jgi:hypothetical protein
MEIAAESRKRPWFQFRLRSLFVAAAVVALLAWMVWHGWPAWKSHREQVRFEKEVRQLKVGATFDDAWKQLESHTYTISSFRKVNGKSLNMVRYDWPNSVYFIYFVHAPHPRNSGSNNIPCASIEVYRLPALANDPARIQREYRSDDRSLRYVRFLEFLASDRQGGEEFQHELIYADPVPAATLQDKLSQ